MSQTTDDIALGGAFGGDEENVVQTIPTQQGQDPTVDGVFTEDTSLGGAFGGDQSPLAKTMTGEAYESAQAAQASEEAAQTSASQAATSATSASTSATQAATSATNAAQSATDAASSESSVAQSATDAATSATSAATSAGQAEASATDAASSATTASGHASDASSSETNAATSETNAATSASQAASSASSASSSATSASQSATSAATSASSASTSATSAVGSATAAQTAEENAETSETNAAGSASSAATSATNAATSASSASTSATSASTSATQAAGSASSASTSATAAATSATSASDSATSASTNASSASQSATAAANSATSASQSATAASGYLSSVQSDADDAADSATAAAGSATAAAGSATSAANSATSASTSATNASTSATNASNSATAAETAETNAETAETNAASSATSAANSATSASTSAGSASTSASNAATSATSASGYATTAQNSADDAADSETEAALSATSAATSATNASTSATAAAGSATSASTSATSASTSATNASNSATSASTSASNALSSAQAAAGSATTAGTHASNASDSADDAEASATSASTSAGTATQAKNDAVSAKNTAVANATAAGTSATQASNSATQAATSAGQASTSATAASTSASNAATSATSASGFADDAADYLDQFTDIYLGAFSSGPTTDNDGDTLATGAIYFDTSNNKVKFWSGTAWLNLLVSADVQSQIDDAVADLVDSAPTTLDTLNELAAALNDDPDFHTTITNSIGTKWTQDDTKISNWDTAYGWGNHASAGYLTSYTETDPVFSAHAASGVTSTKITNWDGAYNDIITSLSFSTSSGVLTATRRDGGTVTVDLDGKYQPLGSYDNYQSWTISDGTNSEAISSGNTLKIVGGGATTASYNSSNNTLTISSTDTNTDTNTTYSAGSGITLSGTQFSHSDTSSQASVDNSGNTVIQDITLDTFGHITGITSKTITAAGLGALTTETDPTVPSHVKGITTGNISNWNTAYSWGNHADAGYLTSFTETDPTVPSHVKSISSGSITNWNTAYNRTTDTRLGLSAHSLTNLSTEALWSKPSGYATMVRASGSNGLPSNHGESYFGYTITSRRDTGGGYSAILTGYSGNKLWFTYNAANTSYPSWKQIFHDGYHPNADKWTTARSHTVTLTGDVTGSATQSVDGTGNKTWSITTTVANNSHEHDHIQGGNVVSTDLNTIASQANSGELHYDSFGSSAANKPPTSDNANGVISVGQHSGPYTAQLAFSSNGRMYYRDNPNNTFGSWQELWTSGNDGSGSGLDADFLDGLHASSFTRADANLVTTGQYNTMHSGAANGSLSVGRSSVQAIKLFVNDADNSIVAYQDADGNSTHNFILQRDFDGTGANNFLIRKGTSNQFALDTNANATFYGNLYVPQYIYHSGDTNTYIRLESDQVSIVAGGTTKFHSSNTYLTTNSTIPYSQLSGTPTIPSVGNGTMTVTAGTSLTGGGSFTANQSGNSSVTLGIATPPQMPANWKEVIAWDGTLKKDSAVKIHGDGYLTATYLNMTHGVGTRSSDTVFYSSNDDFIRKTNATGMRAALDIYTKGEVNALIPTIPTSLPANGGNSDTVDGLHAASFIRSDADDNVTGHTEWQDGKQVRFGNGADFRMDFNGSHMYFRGYNHAAGNIYFQAEDTEGTNHALLYMHTDVSEPYLRLFYNGAEKFKTQSYGGYVTGYIQASASLRAPIFYDTDNTSYYLNPNGTSNLNTVDAVRITQGFQLGDNNGGRLYFGHNDTRSYFAPRNSSDTDWNWSQEFGYNLTNGYWYADGQIYAGSMRSPIYYDHNNTARFVDPASTSQMYHISMNNGNLTGVNNITINDPGPGEGITWGGGNGWKIYESPNDLTTNSGGNLQFVQNSTRRMTIDTSGNLDLPGGNLLVASDKGITTTGAWTRFTTAHGYIRLGPANTSHAHIYTDRSNFYMNKTLNINGGTQLNQNDIRSAIYYDYNNTGYYVNPASTSVLNTAQANSNFQLSSGDGKGLRFWNSDSYKIYMSSTGNSSWGGRVTGEGSSDYNMYFRMKAGTNRGFVFRNDTTNVAGIDASGDFRSTGVIQISNGTAGSPSYSWTADTDSGMFSIGANAVGFSTGGTQRFKINANGLLLTGTSSLYVNGQQTITNTRDIMNVVNYANTDGHMTLKRTANAPLILDRMSTNRGDILNFKSNSSKVGRIGYTVPYGGNFYIAQGNTSGHGLGFYQFSTTFQVNPVNIDGSSKDNQVDLGSFGQRWDDVYATNGTIQTSDRNEKQDIEELTEAERRVAVVCKGLIRKFRWIDSVEEKGNDARYHFGAIAQDVEAAFTAEGLDAGRYGLFIRTNWWDHEGYQYPTQEDAPEGAVFKTRMGIRYNQLLAFIISAI